MSISHRIKDLEQQIAALRAEQQRETTVRLAEIAERMKALHKEALDIAKAAEIDFVIEFESGGDYYGEGVRLQVKGDPYWNSSSAYC